MSFREIPQSISHVLAAARRIDPLHGVFVSMAPKGDGPAWEVPTAAVSGLYFAHPDARYFAVGKINRDQVEHYAERKGMPVPEMERWLAPNLAYEAAP